MSLKRTDEFAELETPYKKLESLWVDLGTAIETLDCPALEVFRDALRVEIDRLYNGVPFR